MGTGLYRLTTEALWHANAYSGQYIFRPELGVVLLKAVLAGVALGLAIAVAVVLFIGGSARRADVLVLLASGFQTGRRVNTPRCDGGGNPASHVYLFEY